MKEFIKEIMNIIAYESYFSNASIPMKMIAIIIAFISCIIHIINVLLLLLTIPLWIIPYVIWWCCRRGGKK